MQWAQHAMGLEPLPNMRYYNFVDTNFGQRCSKKEIWFMFNCQTKRTIVALFIYPEIPPCRVFFWARRSNICLFTQLRNPAQSPFFTTQFASQNPHNFLFFSCTLSEGLYIDYSERMSFEKQRTITKQQIRYFKDNQEVTRNLKLINYKLHSLQEQ